MQNRRCYIRSYQAVIAVSNIYKIDKTVFKGVKGLEDLSLLECVAVFLVPSRHVDWLLYFSRIVLFHCLNPDVPVMTTEFPAGCKRFSTR